MNNAGISVVIPNYNGALLLPEILPSLYLALQQSGVPYEVIICDDCSTDASVQMIREHYPEIILLHNPSNLGFSHAINKCIFAAKLDLVLMLNSDVKLCPHYFDPLFKYFDDPDTFGVMGRIVGWHDNITQDAGKYPARHGLKIKTSGNYDLAKPDPDECLYTMYLSGANALVRREKLLLLNGFDEIFSPFYVEDYELSLRAWRLGWKCYYEHFAVCRHRISATILTANKKQFVRTIYNRNKMYLHAIHFAQPLRSFWFLQIIIEFMMQTVALKKYYSSAFFLFLKSREKVFKSRLAFETLAGRLKTSLVSVDEVMARVKNSVADHEITRF